MSVGPQSRSPFRNLRRALLAVILVLVAGLGGLYWLGRSGPLEPAPAPAPVSLRGATAVSEGFDYTQVVDNQPVFRLRGARFRSTTEGLVELDQVGLTLFREGREYGVESSRATYNPESKEATLTGEVRLTGGGLSLTTNELTLASGGRQLDAPHAVEFSFAEGRGTAGGLKADLDQASISLQTPVNVAAKSRDGADLLLLAERAILDRKAHELRAEGNVSVTAGNARFRAQNVVLVLAEDEKTPQLLRATLQVEGELREPDADAEAPPAFTMSAYSLTLQFKAGESVPEKLEIQGTQGESAVLVTNSPNGLIRVLLSRWVVGHFQSGALTMVETVGSSEVKEYQAGAENKLLRLASAQFAQADLAADRHLEALTLTGGVILRDSRLRAAADRAYLQPDAGTAQLFGESVRVTSERGELRAPRVVYQREGERAHAEGGVEATLIGSMLPNTALAEGGNGEPVRVRAKEAFLELAGNGFVFRGDVQAYQGETVLFADQLRADDAEKRLAASGSVKTVWNPEESVQGEKREPVEVSAKTLTYRESERELLYEGDVTVLQAGRTLRAGSVEVELDENRKARKMVARTKVQLEDPAAGRRVEGDEAIYDLAAKTVIVSGSPAQMRDSTGNILRGKRLTYDLVKGSLRAGGETK